MTWIYWEEKKSMRELSSVYAGSCGWDALPLMVAPLPIWKPSLRRLNGKSFQRSPEMQRRFRSLAMTYSYTQISQYLRCPRAYRHRYLDGWREKDLRKMIVSGSPSQRAIFR